MWKACSIQMHLPSCRDSCELNYQFYAEPYKVSQCNLVLPEWKDECIKRATGELLFSSAVMIGGAGMVGLLALF